jgi:hypothetical protein
MGQSSQTFLHFVKSILHLFFGVSQKKKPPLREAVSYF